MHYGQIKLADMLDGPGLRVTLFVSGCSNNCKGCHNPETHDPYYGKEFTDETLSSIIIELNNSYYSGLTLCGGDPLYPSNRESILKIVRAVKDNFQNKTIWMYTGYTLEEIQSWNDTVVLNILNYVDVLLEGRYIESLRSPTRPWVGSSNQRIFSIEHTESGNKFVNMNI